jgi:hypothetical protein
LSDVLTLSLFLQIVQLSITLVAVTVDLLIVVRLVWIPLIRSMPKEDRPYLWSSVASYAKTAREAAETDRRLAEKERLRKHGG